LIYETNESAELTLLADWNQNLVQHLMIF